MTITEAKHNDTFIVAIDGRLDASNAPDLERALLKQIDGGAKKLLVDCAGLDYISSAGLRVLLVAAKRLKTVDGTVALSGLKHTVREVLDIAGFSPIFRLFADRTTALAGLG
ncbi:MAG: STAS domain-containing protein [Deltaproteobacteria bacterium]|nr:STAS domain-containing protein [Deltaproteobacteria bacterium]